MSQELSGFVQLSAPELLKALEGKKLDPNKIDSLYTKVESGFNLSESDILEMTNEILASCSMQQLYELLASSHVNESGQSVVELKIEKRKEKPVICSIEDMDYEMAMSRMKEFTASLNDELESTNVELNSLQAGFDSIFHHSSKIGGEL
ncbi:hypothetical protein J1N51_00580 [Psychrosphaera ytuae]|uniref:Uncharacterized protein n=1 Tax=Psychrosphaera ytuae TaxID=2820710 RepID=A0A975DC45_9GAMM|nr:hypothetical protein [Psychrosphaera ytuae]QTH64029.1 hypothetical protein J1N51_00580 [Psychrosphaera ytuae]